MVNIVQHNVSNAIEGKRSALIQQQQDLGHGAYLLVQHAADNVVLHGPGGLP
jgi:hypothetical protein